MSAIFYKFNKRVEEKYKIRGLSLFATSLINSIRHECSCFNEFIKRVEDKI